MIRVVVTGSECTGKTTLARALAESYDAPWVAEYARKFVREKGAPPVADDVGEIARGQIAGEDDILAEGPPLVVLDTDLLSTVVYSRHYYGDCPAWIDETLSRRRADLYLLAGLDVPWMPDGDQRDRPHLRPQLQKLFRQALVERDLAFVDIEGDLDQRLSVARLHINPLLTASR